MAGKIKGITIEIGGDTQKLNKALEDVNKKTRDLQGELRHVERLLKLDPKNTELLAQKQKLLAEAVENSREKLDRLKTAQEQVNEQFRRGEINEEQYRAFQREIVKAEQELAKFEKQLRETGLTAEQVGQKLKDAGQKMTDVGKNLSTKVTAPLVGLGAVATKLGMDFEAAMSEVGAISGATGEELEALEAKAKELGATTKFSATEAAEGLKYMAMAGWDTQQMLEGLPGVLSLAAASGEDLGRVSDIVTDAMTAFGMEAAQAGEFADILAAASSNANTNVGMLGESFKYVAPVFGSLGYSAEDAALALGLMANAGIKASQAGTALRGAITRMVKPSKDAATAMDELGLKLTDAEGNMLPFRDIMDQLRSAFANLTAEQQAQYAATIFGQEAMSGMLAIINASEEDYNKLGEAIDNSTGAADRMAKQMQDNLKGRLTELKSAIEGVALQLYEHMKPALEAIVAAIKQVVDWFAKLPPGAQQIIVIIAALAAAIGPLLIVLGAMASGLSAIIGILPVLGAALTALTGPIGIAIAAIAGLVAAGVLIYKNWDKIKETLDRVWGAIVDFFTKTIPEAINKGLKWFSELPGKVAKFMNELPGKIGHALGVALGKIIQFGRDAINWAVAEVPRFIEQIITFYMELPGKIWEWLVKAFNKVVEWGVNLIKWAKAEVPNIISTIIDFFMSMPGKLFEIGANMVKGLWDGIKSMISWIQEKISDFIGGIVSSVEGVLGIKSPSKVFAGIGENISLGLLKGITKQKLAIETALSGLLTPNLALAGSTTNNYSYGGNTIHITVQDGEDLLRTLHRLGVRIP